MTPKATKHIILLFIVLLLPVAIFAQQEQHTTLESNASQWLREDQAGFVENKGQLKDQFGKPNPAVKYLLNMPGLNVQLRATGFSYVYVVTEKNNRLLHRITKVRFYIVNE